MPESVKDRIELLVATLAAAWTAARGGSKFRSTFHTWAERYSSIGGFEDVDDLTAWFQDEKVTYEEKNPIVIALSLLAQEGDQAALALLYFLFIPGFKGVLHKLSGTATPEELFNEMFGAFAEAMLTITPETETASGYLFGKAEGAALSLRRDMIRRRQRESDLDEIAENNLALLGTTDDPADTDPLVKSEFDLIDLAIEAKVLNEREANFARAQVYGASIEQAAQVLGMTLNAAYEMRRRMRQRLKDFIEDREIRARRNI